MALQSVTMTFGTGVRCSAELDCFSTAVATIGTDARFRGTKFSMGFRFKLIAGGFHRIAAIATPHQSLSVIRPSSDATLDIQALLTPASGDITQHSVLDALPENTSEHSVAWTYDADGNSVIYVDGSEVETEASFPIGPLDPATTEDKFSIQGTHVPSTGFDVDEAWYANEVLDAAAIADIHANGV